MSELKECDMCGSEIKDGKCSCGVWTSHEENENNPFKKSLEHFHDMKKFVVTSDMPHLGCAAVFFRGDYLECLEVQKFIYRLKGRPYYE